MTQVKLPNANVKHFEIQINSGARFGLSLTLNIEQYEYMSGPNSDAGIKVLPQYVVLFTIIHCVIHKMFLHPATEVPRVRDLGFAVAPGTHTLVGIQLSRVRTFLLFVSPFYSSFFYRQQIYGNHGEHVARGI